MEINKLIGYTTIEVSDGKLGLKIGAYVLEAFCASCGLSLEEIGNVFVTKEVEVNGELKSYVTPKDPIKFLALVLHHGVNYVSGMTDGKQYPLMQAYEWIDEIGISSPKAINIIAAFMTSIRNGGSPVEIDSDPKRKLKKKAVNVVDPA